MHSPQQPELAHSQACPEHEPKMFQIQFGVSKCVRRLKTTTSRLHLHQTIKLISLAAQYKV